MSGLQCCFDLCSDESGPPKSPWGINIMKKTKKAGPKAFGVRLEDCQPGVNNKVSSLSSTSPEHPPRDPDLSNSGPTLCPVHPADSGDLLRPGGGHGPGVHRHLQSPRQQRHGVHAAGAAQQGRRHQPCGGGRGITGALTPHLTLTLTLTASPCVSPTEVAGPQRRQQPPQILLQETPGAALHQR